ncbi:uncharacterized protein LOC129883649 [Solanum dulcamara]|uniref:uncharacterized protein LOC129883649 n=1 Tax=Solanum dulcamara TaxID=45834 RepID=UPI00248530A5|nr:uncharacterized protein LOC129883649 [Solanum dulcamara]
MLNNNNYKEAAEKIQQIINSLKRSQLKLATHYTDALALEEKDLLIQLEKWTNIEKSIQHQKSRAMWIKLGDSNNNTTVVSKAIMRTGPTLNHIQQLTLCVEDIYEAVKEFFNTGKLYKDVNCTAVTLLPKVPNLSNIREYRPIACCTILYKLIAKVLADRIQKVIANVISQTQAGFIPGRKVADNIMLAMS